MDKLNRGISAPIAIGIIIVLAIIAGAGIIAYQHYFPILTGQNQGLENKNPQKKGVEADSLNNATLTFLNPYDESKNDTIKLVDGHAFLSEPNSEMPRVYDLAKIAVGDLDGDEIVDGVIGLYQGFGANITRPVIFVLSNRNGALEQIDSALPLSEAVDAEIKSISISSGVLTVDLLVVPEKDLQTLPHFEWQATEEKSVQYKLVNGKLVEYSDVN